MIRYSEPVRRLLKRLSPDRDVAGAGAEILQVGGERAGAPRTHRDGALMFRDYLTIEVRRATNNRPVEFGFWSGHDQTKAQVENPISGQTETKTFEGAGALIQIGPVPRTADLQAHEINITVSAIDERMVSVVQGYLVQRASIVLYRGVHDPATRLLAAPAFPEYVGDVIDMQVTVPGPGESGQIDLTCISELEQLTDYSPIYRGPGSQRRRAPGDAFYDDVGGTPTVDWGVEIGIDGREGRK
ncbi:MAG: hypothetical protein AAFU61_07780 [Pseudomonadota bacterium]